MSILIGGIRIDEIKVKIKGDDGGIDGVELEAAYSLLKTDGGVLAKQTVNGYNADLTLAMSADMAKAIRAVSTQLKSEIETLLGINEEGDAT